MNNYLMKEYVRDEYELHVGSGVKHLPVSQAAPPLSPCGPSSDWPSTPAALDLHRPAAPTGGSSSISITITLRISQNDRPSDLACPLTYCRSHGGERNCLLIVQESFSICAGMWVIKEVCWTLASFSSYQKCNSRNRSWRSFAAHKQLYINIYLLDCNLSPSRARFLVSPSPSSPPGAIPPSSPSHNSGLAISFYLPASKQKAHRRMLITATDLSRMCRMTLCRVLTSAPCLEASLSTAQVARSSLSTRFSSDSCRVSWAACSRAWCRSVWVWAWRVASSLSSRRRLSVTWSPTSRRSWSSRTSTRPASVSTWRRMK